MIKFKDSTHTYIKDKTPYISVTTLIGKYEPQFEAEVWSLYKAMQAIYPPNLFKRVVRAHSPKFVYRHVEEYPEYLSDVRKKQKSILAEWDKTNKDALIRGTNYHNNKEDESYVQGHEINPFDSKSYKTFEKEREGSDNESIIDDLFLLKDGYYPELLIWNQEFQLAGQADKVFIESRGDFRYIDIGDYKTNKKITTSNKYEKFFSPLQHLEHSKLNTYTLQISTYAWMLECFGFVVRDLSFDHVDHDNNETHYNLEYLGREVKTMLEHYKTSSTKKVP